MKNLLLFLLAATLFACDKEKDETKFDLDDFFDKHKPKEQAFTFSADSVYWKKVISDKGGVFEFNTAPVYDEQYNLFTGEIIMKVVELYSKSDIVLNKMNTVDKYGQLLKSNGMMKISFSQGTTTVAPLSNMKITVPSTDYFYQDADFYMLMPGFSSNSWSPEDSIGIVIDSCGGVSCSAVVDLYSAVILNYFNWLNCDYPIDTPYTNISVNVVAEDSIKHYRGYIVLKNEMAVTDIYYSYSDSAFVGTNIPVAEPVTVIIIGTNTEGVVYSGIKEFIVSENIEVDVPMNPTTEEELLAAIRALD